MIRVCPSRHDTHKCRLVVAYLVAGLLAAIAPESLFAVTPTPTPHCDPTPANLPQCGLPPVMAMVPLPTPIPFTCANMNDDTFHFQSNARYRFNKNGQAICQTQRKVIAVAIPTPNGTPRPTPANNIYIDGNGVIFQPSNSNADSFHVIGTDVAVANFTLQPRGSTRFQEGVVVENSAQRTTIINVDVVNATRNAGVQIGGQGACIIGGRVLGAGVTDDSPGYDVTTNAGGSFDFRGVVSMGNRGDGFAIENGNSGGLAKVQFLNCMAVGNLGDAYDTAGPKVEVLCSEARGPDPTPTGTPATDTGRGITCFGANLRVENSVISGNRRLGINLGNATGNIFSSTIVGNARKHENKQLFGNTNSTMRVCNSIVDPSHAEDADPPVFINSTGSIACKYDVYTGTVNGRSGGTDCHDGAGMIMEQPAFSSDRLIPAATSAGVDDGIDPATCFGSVDVLVASSQDIRGLSRPQNSGYDRGAFELSSISISPTPGPTRTGTRSRPTRTMSNTRTPTASVGPTATPCTDSCPGDCNANGFVAINEVILGVDIALGSAEVEACPQVDRDCDEVAAVNEIIAAIDAALEGCAMTTGASLRDSIGKIAVKVGSAAGQPGNTVEFPVQILNSGYQAAGLNVDLLTPTSITAPVCILNHDLGQAGFKLLSRESFGNIGGYRATRLILSQASQHSDEMGGMLDTGPTMADGIFMTCQAQIAANAAVGSHVLSAASSTDPGYLTAAQAGDNGGNRFDAVVNDGVLAVNGTVAPDAIFVSQTVPSSMTAGEAYEVSVTVWNIGGSVWTPSQGYRLRSQNSQDNVIWSMNRVDLADTEAIEPGQAKTFTWKVLAPPAAGTYHFQWGMIQEGYGAFGGLSANVDVTVSCPACGCS